MKGGLPPPRQPRPESCSSSHKVGRWRARLAEASLGRAGTGSGSPASSALVGHRPPLRVEGHPRPHGRGELRDGRLHLLGGDAVVGQRVGLMLPLLGVRVETEVFYMMPSKSSEQTGTGLRAGVKTFSGQRAGQCSDPATLSRQKSSHPVSVLRRTVRLLPGPKRFPRRSPCPLHPPPPISTR